MSECSSKGTCGKSSCEGCSQNTAKGPQSMQVKENAHSRVKKVIGVVSGKGGVGKSMVTSLLAVAMNRKGYKTAIMDADITGPSIPTAFGLNDHAVANDDGLLPEVTKNGIKVDGKIDSQIFDFSTFDKNYNGESIDNTINNMKQRLLEKA